MSSSDRGLPVLWLGGASPSLERASRSFDVVSTRDVACAADILSTADIERVVVELESVTSADVDSLREHLESHPTLRETSLLLLSPAGPRAGEATGAVLRERVVAPDRVAEALRVPTRPLEPSSVALSARLRELARQEADGLLIVRTEWRRGEIRFRGGRWTRATVGLLRGRGAVLELLSESRHHRFVPDAGAGQVDGEGHAVGRVLDEYDRLRIELEGLSSRLPSPTARLRVIAPLHSVSRPRPDLPLEELHDRVRILPGITRAELAEHDLVSRVRLDLGLAYLAAEAVLAGQVSPER